MTICVNGSNSTLMERFSTRSAAVACVLPDEIDHGGFSILNNEFNGQLLYFCETGYRLSTAVATRTCDDSGDWFSTDSVPTCDSKSVKIVTN